MSAPLHGSAAVYRACIVSAVKRSGGLMADLVRAVRDPAAQEGDATRASAAGAVALQLLIRNEARLIAQYPMAMLELFALSGASAVAARGATGNARGAVDDAQVRVEMARARQQIAREAAPALSELDTLIGAAQGLERVQPERNPLRPGNYVRALYAVVGGAGVAHEVGRTWLQWMQGHIGVLLVREYRRVSDELRAQGIQPLPYVPTGRRRTDSANDGSGSTFYGDSSQVFLSPTGAAALPEIDASMWDSVRPSYFAPAEDAVAAARSSSGASEALPERVGQSLQGVAPVDENAYGGDPALGRDVLAQMIDTIVRDGRMLPVVRHALIQLEPVLRQLVDQDSSFFFDERHPARLLLDALTARGLEGRSRSAQWRGRFGVVVERMAGSLAAEREVTPEAFGRALQWLETSRLDADSGLSAGGQLDAGMAPWGRRESDRVLPDPTAPKRVPEPDPVVIVPPSAKVTSAVASRALDGAAEAPVLELGDWVEIAAPHGAVRTRLTWCSPRQTLFLFTQSDGGTQSMTRRMVAKMLRDGTMKRVSG